MEKGTNRWQGGGLCFLIDTIISIWTLIETTALQIIYIKGIIREYNNKYAHKYKKQKKNTCTWESKYSVAIILCPYKMTGSFNS